MASAAIQKTAEPLFSRKLGSEKFSHRPVFCCFYAYCSRIEDV